MALSVKESVKDCKSPREVSKLKKKICFCSTRSLVGRGNIAEQGGKSCSQVKFFMHISAFTSHAILTLFCSKHLNWFCAVIGHAG